MVLLDEHKKKIDCLFDSKRINIIYVQRHYVIWCYCKNPYKTKCAKTVHTNVKPTNVYVLISLGESKLSANAVEGRQKIRKNEKYFI